MGGIPTRTGVIDGRVRTRGLRYISKPYTISRTVSRTDRRKQMTKEICQFCGWEVPNPDWYNYYNQSPICDDCNMDMALEREKQNA